MKHVFLLNGQYFRTIEKEEFLPVEPVPCRVAKYRFMKVEFKFILLYGPAISQTKDVIRTIYVAEIDDDDATKILDIQKRKGG